MCYYDIPEDLWLRLEPILPTEASPRGGRPTGDVRNFRNAVCTLDAANRISMASFAREIRFVENCIFPFQALAEKRISNCYSLVLILLSRQDNPPSIHKSVTF